MYEQRRQDNNQSIGVPDPQQDAQISNISFTPTDPRFRDSNNNRLNPNSEGRIQGVENSQAAANFKAYSALRASLLEAADANIKAKARTRKEANVRDIDKTAVMNQLKKITDEGDIIKMQKEQTDLLLGYMKSTVGVTDVNKKELHKDFIEKVDGRWTGFREDGKLTDEEKAKMLEDIQWLYTRGYR